MKDFMNPWESMDASTQRRIEFETKRDFFWMRDLDGNYGLFLKSDTSFEEDGVLVRFKGMTILWRNSKKRAGEIFLVLHDKRDWQMFRVLCEDLILHTHRSENGINPTDVIERRLRDWQDLLSLQ